MTSSTSVTAPVKEGKLALSDAQKKTIAVFLHRNEGNHVRLTFSKPGKPRSNNQNKFLWGVMYAMIAEETGNTTEDIHAFCRASFLPKSFITLGGQEREVEKSTTDLSTDEMSAYQDRIRAFAAQELNLVIPLPNQIDY
jgi:hypothetical protein